MLKFLQKLGYEDIELGVYINPKCPNKNPVRLPAKPGDVGYDLVSWLDTRSGKVDIQPGETLDIRTGASVVLPEGYWADVRSRSSTYIRRKLLVNPGVIDQQYRGELSICVTNTSSETQTLVNGERLAQLVILPAIVLPIKQIKKLPKSVRGITGFGSSGA